MSAFQNWGNNDFLFREGIGILAKMNILVNVQDLGVLTLFLMAQKDLVLFYLLTTTPKQPSFVSSSLIILENSQPVSSFP